MIKEEFIIPSSEGKMFKVKKGQTLRLIEVEGLQAADLIIFNEHDMNESFSAWLTRHNSRSFSKANKLYSKLPFGNIMFTVLTEKEGIYFLSPGRCNRMTYELHQGIKDHKNCQDILAELIKPYGMKAYDVPEVLNIFMNVVYNKDGSYEYLASPVSKGDYVDLMAEMDCLVGISSCPGEGVINGFKAKPLGIKIFEE